MTAPAAVERARCPWCLETTTVVHVCEYEDEAAAALDELHTAPEIRQPFRTTRVPAGRPAG